MRGLVLGLASLAGCYSPAIPDCAYTCAQQSDCPAEQVCDTAQQACRAAGVTGTCNGAGLDAPPGSSDGPPPVDAGGGSGAIALVAHAIHNGKGTSVSTGPINTTGASLLVAAVCTYSTGTPAVPTDSAGNAWNAALATYGADAAPANLKIFYAVPAITSTAATVTAHGNDFMAISVLAFAGTRRDAGAYQGEEGSAGATPLTMGTLTPSALDQLFVAFACSGQSLASSESIDGGFTIADQQLNGTAGKPEDLASAWRVSTDLAPLQPTWTFFGDGQVVGSIAAFMSP